MTAEKAISILEAEKEQGQFDPHLIEAFIAMIREDLRQKEQE